MANELSINLTLKLAGQFVNTSFAPPNNPTMFSPANPAASTAEMTVPNTSGGTALALGGFAALGYVVCYCPFTNSDYVQLMTAVSGTVFARLSPGDFCLLKLEPTLAPAAISHASPQTLWIVSCSA